MKIITSILLFLMGLHTTLGNVGESVDQITARYGKPVTSGDSKRGRVVVYNSAGFTVGVIYERGMSKMEAFTTKGGAKLTEGQITGILTAHSDGHKWSGESPWPHPRTLYRDDSQLMASLSADGASLVIQEVVETHTKETHDLVLAMQEVKRAGDKYQPLLLKALSFDIQKALAPGNEKYYYDWLLSSSELLAAANKYVDAWEHWKHTLVGAAKAEPDAFAASGTEALSARAEKAERVAQRALDYADSVAAFGKARKQGGNAAGELHEVTEARKRVLDSQAALE